MEDDQEILNEIVMKVAKEQGYENCKMSTKKISSAGANYTSYLYLSTLSAQQKEDLSLFVKIAATGEEMRSNAPFRNFEIESLAYNKLLTTYKEIEKKHSVAAEHRLATAKFYASSEEYLREAIVLQDLTASGYTTYDRFKSVDWEYASKSVENLAKLHALSIAWSIEEPEVFGKIETAKIDANLEGIKAYLERVVANAIKVTREENKERVSKYTKKLVDGENSIGVFYRPIRRPVITHSDYRPSNLMYKILEDGTVDLISVDYQTLQRGNPIWDLIYFIYTGSDKSFRDKHFHQTLNHYYTELCAALQRLDLDPDQIYPRDDFEYELKQILPSGLMIAMFSLLIVTVDTDDAPKVGKDIAITDLAINPNTLYTERLNDVVDDFVKMGMI